MPSFKNTIINLLPAPLYLFIKRTVFSVIYKKRFLNLQNKRKIQTDNSYSFKPFDDTKSIFVHIPKCAGVSMNKTLYGNLAGAHTTLSDYTCIFSPKEINEYFKFTIVRNPWDRLVSAFHFLKKGGMNETDKIWAQSNLGEYKDFRSFVLKWLNQDNIWKYYHFQPQHHYFLESHQKVCIDFFAFLENLDNDFEFIAKKINSTHKLQQKNQSQHKDYKDYYDNETIKIVSKVYADDIRLLGYKFDNSSLAKQIHDRDSSNKFPYTRL
ncbi:sulfotransferase family 2 domain-containing protein [Kaarinaea lacus]